MEFMQSIYLDNEHVRRSERSQMTRQVKESCQQALTSDDTILESRPTNRSIIPTSLPRSTSKDTMTSQILNAHRRLADKSVIACFMTLLLISLWTGMAECADPQHILPLSVDDFWSIKCRGDYDSSMFARLDRVCEDCNNLYHGPLVYLACRDDCFNNPYFKGCVDSLYQTDELQKFRNYIHHLHNVPYGKVSF